MNMKNFTQRRKDAKGFFKKLIFFAGLAALRENIKRLSFLVESKHDG
jgi:hypothetical protein